MSNSRNWNMFILLCLCLGSVFRLIWVQDMEYKGDEAWWFHKSQVIGRTEPIPMRGLISASGVDNPGMSLWIMAALAQGFGLDTPTSFVRAIQVGAILALVVLFLFARQRLSGAERQQWYWGGALASVNFTAVLFSRKLWPVELLPIFSIFFLMAWWQRRNFWGAFFWGLLGALLGQIQMSGFFFAAALFLWTALFNRKAVRWPAWVLGSAIGALPLIPWLAYIAAGESGQRGIDWNFHAPPIGEYFGYVWHFVRYGRDWFEYALGTSWVSSIGNHEAEFARYPIVGGYETYLVFAARTLLMAAFVYIGGRLLYPAGLGVYQTNKSFALIKWPKFLPSAQTPPSVFLIQSGLIGMGLLFTLGHMLNPYLPAGFWVHRHYLIVAFPLPYVCLANLALRDSKYGEKLLLGMWCAQVVVTAAFLYYIHVNCGAPGADYDVAFGCQPGL